MNTNPATEPPNSYVGLLEKLGIEVVAVGPESTTLTMPVATNTQPAGVLHGGASGALCETAASLGAQAHAHQIHGPGAFAVGTNLTVSHLRPARKGKVTAIATAKHLGRTSTVHAVEVYDEAQALVATALVTNRVIIDES